MIWRQTPKLCITNYCRTKNPFYRKVQQRLKEIYRVKQQPKEKPQKSNKQDIEHKHLQTDQSLHPTGRMQWIILRLWHFFKKGHQGRRTHRWKNHWGRWTLYNWRTYKEGGLKSSQVNQPVKHKIWELEHPDNPVTMFVPLYEQLSSLQYWHY